MTAEARVRVTVAAAMLTVLTVRAAPATVTPNALAAGTEVPSRVPSKVSLSVVPFTVALWNMSELLVVAWTAIFQTADSATSVHAVASLPVSSEVRCRLVSAMLQPAAAPVSSSSEVVSGRRVSVDAVLTSSTTK